MQHILLNVTPMDLRRLIRTHTIVTMEIVTTHLIVMEIVTTHTMETMEIVTIIITDNLFKRLNFQCSL